MDLRKDYTARLFIKKCTLTEKVIGQHIKFHIDLLEQTHSADKKFVEIIKKRFNVEEYINRIAPVVSEMFTIEEMQESIKFFSSGAGKKLIDSYLLDKIDEIGNKMFSQMEQEFFIRAEK